MKSLCIGIDEAGRGAWAGPLVVASVAATSPDALAHISGIMDSKMLSPVLRERAFDAIMEAEKQGNIVVHTSVEPTETIDALGIRGANMRAMESLLMHYTHENWHAYIDGADNFVFSGVDTGYIFANKSRTKNPKPGRVHAHRMVEYVIGGDASIMLISAASIVAKVLRDRIMDSYDMVYPEYGF